jgi:hypothetical protein
MILFFLLLSIAVNMVGAHPFVLQTYKSAMCFLTSWIVLLLGVDFKFTPWGIASGLMWVSGGVCGIFGIRNAGLAISVGTWSSITVLVSFSWGIFFFGERVQSTGGTAFGILFMIVGFIGMAYFASSEDGIASILVDTEASLELTMDLAEPLLENDGDDQANGDVDNKENPRQEDNALDEINGSPITEGDQSSETNINQDEKMILFCGIKWERKVLGVLGAAVDGILGGSNLIPMKLAPSM